MATTKKIIQKDAQGNVIEVDIGANATNITQDSTHRFVTDTEKTIWNAKQNAITIDTALSSSSTNPVQNKIVNTALAGKASSSHTHSNYVNQNAFSNITVGSTTIAADSATDMLTLVAGSNVNLVADATNDKVTINATDTKYTHPTAHPASMITQDSTHRFTTDAEKESWNKKANESHVHSYTSLAERPAGLDSGYVRTGQAKGIEIGEFATATGKNTRATGTYSWTGGNSTKAAGTYSWAGGVSAAANASLSFTYGDGTIANNFQTVFGRFNKETGSVNTTSYSVPFFVIGNGNYSGDRSNAFSVFGNSNVYTGNGGSYNSSGADYGEFYEWLDGNQDEEDRVGYFVTLVGDKIKIANKDDYIIGAISAISSVVGNSDEDYRYRFKKDSFGRVLYETVKKPKIEMREIRNQEGKIIGIEEVKTKEMEEITQKITNDTYNSEEEYIMRSQRKEWDVVGMLGQLIVYDDGTCKVNEYCKVKEKGIATKANQYEIKEYNGLNIAKENYRVIERIAENIVKIVFR